MSLEELKQQRTITKKNISRIKTVIEANAKNKNLSVADLKCRLGILESYFKQILSTQTKIESLDPDDSGRGDIEDFEYKNFITSFKQIIDREHGLSNIEKFNHLINCLQGHALETVKAFQITNENYPKALERLKSRYDNNTLIFMENISTLFELPDVSKPNSGQLRSIVDNVSALYSSLQSLGSDKDIVNAMLIHIVMQKVDGDTKRKWKDSLDFSQLPTWDDCSKVLERRYQYLESLDTNTTSRRPEHHSGKSSQKQSKLGYSFSCTKRVCALCSKSDHYIAQCQRFKDMDVPLRFENAKKLGLCINCLAKGHQVTNCPSSFKCKTCSRSHHTMLHRSQLGPRSTTPEPTPSTSSAVTNNTSASVHTHMEGSSPHILLATAMVFVKDDSGSYKLGRALLDSCSQVNFVTDEFAHRLKLQRHKCFTTVKSRITDYEVPLSFCITPHISYQPDSELDVSTWNLPPNTQLADESFFKSKKIDLLIGTETFFDILSVGEIKLGPDLPKLQKTLFGWIVTGKYNAARDNNFNLSYLLSTEEEININLEHLWKIEEINDNVSEFTPEQMECEKFFQNTVSRESSGRIVVKLPFKEPSNSLCAFRNTALQRFASLEWRLNRDADLKAKYVSFMKEYEDSGHMSLVKNPKLHEPHYYIPHHCVFKPNSTSTKLRVVFDASCPTANHKSLNEILMVGPTIQEELFLLLLRFRLYRFALTADIVKMYRQVLVDQRDRRFQYILWRYTDQDEIKTYQLKTVKYGTSAAPFLAVRSLHYIADELLDRFELGAKAIKTSFYVDDFLGGAETIEDLTELTYQVTEILKMAYLNLDESSVTSALGISWDQQTDNFLFSFSPKSYPGSVTKRTILSLSSSLFDPLGFLATLIIKAKIILQELWILNIAWDESIPQDLHTAWINLVHDFELLSSLQISRYCLSPNPISIQLHGFCDSSIRPYGCCLYIRVKTMSGKVHSQLYTAKSRVAPTKRKSLPNLELCGAQLLSRLYMKTRNILNIPKSSVFLWTDSQIVLHWLKQHSSTLSVFVGNRISEIQDSTSDCNWRHVPSSLNPADIVSRGSTVQELQSSIWFSGPDFPTQESEKWPPNRCDEIDHEIVNKEKRKTTLNLQVVAWIFRFFYKLSSSKSTFATTETLQPQELDRAVLSIVWNIQQTHFKDDIKRALKKQDPEGSLKCLNPFIDSSSGIDILKVGGRLELADIPEAQKHPIILPKDNNFVVCYVRHLHIKNYHAGPKALVSLTRMRYWIFNLRSLCRKIVNSCPHCIRYRPKLLQQVMSNLPVDRLNPSRVFAKCAVDFCGPVNTYLRIRGKIPYKTYIAVFVCLTTKAVHIEAVSDLSTDAFIAALKRMIGRRVLPTDIYCDNGTNFVGANSKMKDLKIFLFDQNHQNEIVNYCANEFVNFHFIPPRAPHFGGLWEAAVKSAKPFESNPFERSTNV
ncbi:uncharacterized protein LOC142224812 [Haematobia irritans]|uniref:uncharacterized protein LOC142224812 n=1 Tax=Haematobia irritans TaxID=7368 RepID=UPI003F4FDBFE